MSLGGHTGRSAIAGLSCALIVLIWQFLTVHYNYHGSWSGLFCTGDRQRLSPIVETEHPFEFAESYGWDGQFYHAIAHDPLLQRGTAPYIDSARLRYRRILIPALAFLLAAGRDPFVDAAYHTLILLFLALGAWWLAHLCQAAGRSAALGLAVLFVPASLASIDRQAVDAGLLAFCCGFALYTRYIPNARALYAVLLLSALARDTGLLLTAAYCLWLLFERGFRKCAVFSTAAAPTLLWYAFVNSRTESYDGDTAFWAIPFSGVLHRLTHPTPYFGASLRVGVDQVFNHRTIEAVIQGADLVAAAGVLFALFLAFEFVWHRRPDPVEWAIVLFALLGILVWKPGDWLEALDYGRILSPLLFFEALTCLDGRSWWNLAPIGMILPRFGIEMGTQIIGVVRGLL